MQAARSCDCDLLLRGLPSFMHGTATARGTPLQTQFAPVDSLYPRLVWRYHTHANAVCFQCPNLVWPYIPLSCICEWEGSLVRCQPARFNSREHVQLQQISDECT